MQNRETFTRVKIGRGKFLYAIVFAIDSGNAVPTFTLIGIKVKSIIIDGSVKLIKNILLKTRWDEIDTSVRGVDDPFINRNKEFIGVEVGKWNIFRHTIDTNELLLFIIGILEICIVRFF